jgi:hypothetical protein
LRYSSWTSLVTDNPSNPVKINAGKKTKEKKNPTAASFAAGGYEAVIPAQLGRPIIDHPEAPDKQMTSPFLSFKHYRHQT